MHYRSWGTPAVLTFLREAGPVQQPGFSLPHCSINLGACCCLMKSRCSASTLSLNYSLTGAINHLHCAGEETEAQRTWAAYPIKWQPVFHPQPSSPLSRTALRLRRPINVGLLHRPDWRPSMHFWCDWFQNWLPGPQVSESKIRFHERKQGCSTGDNRKQPDSLFTWRILERVW